MKVVRYSEFLDVCQITMIVVTEWESKNKTAIK